MVNLGGNVPTVGSIVRGRISEAPDGIHGLYMLTAVYHLFRISSYTNSVSQE